jgi:hypothetical protein
LDTYSPWLADFQRRLAQHDAGVASLAADIAARTEWTVQCTVAEGFPDPPETIAGAPDVLCRRGPTRRPAWFEVELPETMVRRETVQRLKRLAGNDLVDTRVVLVSPAPRHEEHIPEARRLLMRVGIVLPVVAIAPGEGIITGSDW